MRKRALIAAGVALWFLSATAQARFLQADPVGYQDDLNLYAYVYNDPVNKKDPTGATCETDKDGKVTACHFDKVVGKLTLEQKQQLRAAETAYTKAVQKLQADPDREVSITLAKPDAKGNPTKETRSVTTTAGAVAHALIGRTMVAAPNLEGVASTKGNVTTMKAGGMSGAVNLFSIKNASPAVSAS